MRIIAFLAIYLLPLLLHSQNRLSLSLDNNENATFVLPVIDNQVLQNTENTKDTKQEIPHFAHPFYVDITPETQGEWQVLENGNHLWKLQMLSEKAASMNLGFAEYVLAGNAQLSIYDVHTNQLLGSFSALDNDAHKQLFTPILETDFIRIELVVHPRYKDLIRLRLNQVNHAFVALSQKSLTENCHIDVNCGAGDNLPEVDKYRNQINAVGLITINGIGFCTGVLVNNTKNDFKPYFITAEHCGIKSNNAASVVVYWNFHNSTCRELDSVTNTESGDGDLNIANSGAQVRSFFNPSDMTLLELDDPVPSQADAFFAGWNRTWNGSGESAIIHHPNGEEKRISINLNPVERSNHFSEPMANGNHWRVKNWDLGSTESGSSGGPLFDETGKLIGQLHGGDAACGEEGSDWFGAIAASWQGGGADNTQLKAWLDADNINPTALEGIPLKTVNPLATGATIISEISCFGAANAQVEVTALGGISPYLYSKDGLNFTHNPVFENLDTGEYIFYVLDESGNLSASATLTITTPQALAITSNLIQNDLFVEVTGGRPPYEYSLDGNTFQTNNVFTFTEQGTQTIYVQDANACRDSTLTEIAWSALSIDHRVVASIPCHGDTLGIFELIIDGGISPYGVFQNGVFQAEKTFINQGAGAYPFMIVDSALDTLYYTIDMQEPEPIALELESVEDRIVATASGGTGAYAYSLDNVAYQADNLFENLINGTYEVFVVDENQCLTSDTASVFMVATTNLEKQQIRVYPNPSSAVLYLSMEGAPSDVESLQIYNVEGKMIWEANSDINFPKSIKIKNWANGVYFVHIQGDTISEVHQVVKK